ncbi:MAG: hypothetical protein JXR45_09390 [Deltaproteobacteria bacterium]|nr:hypothetical protein [Deltaproteobacteria bacterium]
MSFTVAVSVAARTPVGNEVFGVGVQLGDPTAVTAKIMPSEVFAFQFYLGGGHWYHDYDYYHGNMFITGLDFVFHPVMIYDGWRTCALNLTLGAGAAVGIFRGWYTADNWNYDWRYDRYYYSDDYYAALFIRFVTGVNLWFKKFPLETFVELTPSLRLINPEPIGFHMFWVAAGARWFF